MLQLQISIIFKIQKGNTIYFTAVFKHIFLKHFGHWPSSVTLLSIFTT